MNRVVCLGCLPKSLIEAEAEAGLRIIGMLNTHLALTYLQGKSELQTQLQIRVIKTPPTNQPPG